MTSLAAAGLARAPAMPRWTGPATRSDPARVGSRHDVGHVFGDIAALHGTVDLRTEHVDADAHAHTAPAGLQRDAAELAVLVGALAVGGHINHVVGPLHLDAVLELRRRHLAKARRTESPTTRLWQPSRPATSGRKRMDIQAALRAVPFATLAAIATGLASSANDEALGLALAQRVLHDLVGRGHLVKHRQLHG